MPTFMQKVRLALKGWQRRRAEQEREALARNMAWGKAPAPAAPAPPVAAAAQTQRAAAIDMDGLTCAFLDDSGRIAYYLDVESGDVIDVRDGSTLAPPRYRRVPSRSEASEGDDRRAFVATLEPSPTRDALARTAASAEAFRQALSDDRAAERAWYSFKNDRAIAAIRAWLQSWS